MKTVLMLVCNRIAALAVLRGIKLLHSNLPGPTLRFSGDPGLSQRFMKVSNQQIIRNNNNKQTKAKRLYKQTGKHSTKIYKLP